MRRLSCSIYWIFLLIEVSYLSFLRCYFCCSCRLSKTQMVSYALFDSSKVLFPSAFCYCCTFKIVIIIKIM